MSSSEHKFDLKFEAQGTENALRDLRQVIRSIDMMNMSWRMALLNLERLNLPPDLKAAVSVINTVISTLYALRAAMIAVQAVSGPVGWAMLIGGAAVGVGTYVYSQMEMDARTGNY